MFIIDTITHSLVGACIALIVVKTDSFDSVFYSFLMSILGSNIPDIDVLTRLSGKVNYLRSHRALTHNFFMLVIFSFVVGLVGYFVTSESFWATFILILITSLVHVLLDSLNSYGVKVAPRSRWIRMGVINTTDIVLMGLLASFFLFDWYSNSDNVLWLIGLVILLYLFVRVVIYLMIKIYIYKHYHSFDSYRVFSAINSFKYEAIIEYNDHYIIVNFYLNKVVVIRKEKQFVRKDLLDIVKDRKNYKTFVDFSPYYYERLYEASHYYKLKFTDLRYHRSDGFFFFNLIYIIDKDTLEVVKEDLSFSLTRKRIIKKFWV